MLQTTPNLVMPSLERTKMQITVGTTSFRRDRIAWAVRRGLSRTERFCKWAMMFGGVGFFAVLGYAKGNYFSLESLLALLPILVALGIRTNARLASSGDSPDVYNDRIIQPGGEFERIADALRPDCVEVISQFGNYHYLFNPGEIHWIKPWYHVNFKPLRLLWVFGIYSWIVYRGFQLPPWPGLADLNLLNFQPHTTMLVAGASAALGLLGLISVAASYKRGVQMACQGGVLEKLFLYPADQTRVIAAVEEGWSVQAVPAVQTRLAS